MITFNQKACYYCKNDTWNQLEYKGICPDVDAKEEIPMRFCHLTPIDMIQCIVLFDDRLNCGCDEGVVLQVVSREIIHCACCKGRHG